MRTEAKAMGDVEGMNRLSAGGGHRVAAGLLLLAAIGCTSSQPARVVGSNPAPEQAPPAAGSSAGSAPARGASTAGAKSVAAAAEIRSLELREGAPEVYVDLEASAPLVWTSFRNPEGKVVVELPNAVPASRVQDVTPEDGLVSSVKVQRETEGTRPMTRLVISTRHEVEHSVTADGLHLQIRLLPLPLDSTQAKGGPAEGAKQKLAFEPVPGPSAAAGAGTADPPPPPPQPQQGSLPPAVTSAPMRAGTPDAPAVAPQPAGAPATRLEAIEVLGTDGGGAVIRISGDGEFPYSTFALSDPNRFVLDLQGVVNRSSHSTLAVTGGVVQRVRVAQFKPGPKGVARVVFDLKQGTVPRIERMPRALVVSFEQEGAAPSAAATPIPLTSPPPPAPPTPPTANGVQQAPSSSSATAATALSSPGRAAAAAPMASSHTKATLATPPPPGPPPSDLALRPASSGGAGTSPPVQMAMARRQPDIQVEDAPPGSRGKASSGLPHVAPGANSFQQPPADLGRRQAATASEKLGTDINPDQKTYSGEPIDLKVNNAEVTDVLRTFAQISGLNIVVQPGVTGTVTAELENVPWDQAFEEVLKINNLGYEREGNVIRIAPNNVLKQEAQDRQQLAQARALVIPLRTVMRRLSYANAGNVAALLKSGQAGLLTQRGSVIVDERTNTLIIKELPEFLDAVLSVISNLDTPEPQVMIEARIIETTKTFSRSLGINWNFNGVADAAHGNTTGLVFPNNGTVAGAVTLAQPGNGTLNLNLGNVLNTFTLDLALQAAEAEGLVNVLSAPKVATLNNRLAYIQSGVQLPVQTIANNTVTVQYIDATLRLEVTPQVTAEGTVVMDINISKKQPDTGLLVPNAASAPIDTKEAKTRLVVRDGGTAVIGGIYKVTTDANEGRVPGLASLPIVGYLFRNKERDQTNDELLIFITPRVIKI
jgi:type IV pilus assembly protein PilQ